MKNLGLKITIAMACANTGWAENYTGKVQSREAGNEVLFHFTRSYSARDSKTVGVGEYKSPDGTLVVREETLLDGSNVLSHAIQQNQLKEQGKLVVEGKKLRFSYTKDGVEKTSEEDLADNLVVSASLIPYIQKNWGALANGDTVKIRFAALDRRETVGFDLFKVSEAGTPADQICIKMKPSSFIIAALVNPLLICLNSSSKHLVKISGRTAPKTLAGTKWKDLDAETVYEVSQ